MSHDAPPTGWTGDALEGVESCTLHLGADRRGPVVATLLRHLPDAPLAGVVLHVHGFVDYFFHAHVAAGLARARWATYGLDLRGHGRSLRPHQLANTCNDLHEYFADLDAALDVIAAEHPGVPVVLSGHSTGGLTGALYADHGERRSQLAGLVLNSPFLAFNLPTAARWALPAAGTLGAVAPAVPVGRARSLYGRSIHASTGGEWTYELAWKPLDGFPVRAGWIRAIRRAHRAVRAGLSIEAPILVLRSDRSVDGRAWSDDLRRADSVLDVDDIARLSTRLGTDVRIVTLPGAVHDVMLSAAPVRERALDTVLEWLACLRDPVS